MTINGIWLIPFAAPFVVNMLIRAVFWFSGADITDPHLLAFVSLFAGAVLGGIGAAALSLEGVRWPITLRRNKP